MTMAAVVLLGFADPAADIRTVAYAALLLGFCGATFDIVIDAYRIELLTPEQLGVGSGMSQYGWRIGAATAASLALFVAFRTDWTLGYIACAPLALSALVASLVMGETRRHREPSPKRGTAERSEERRVGKSVSVRVDLGGRRIIKKKRQIHKRPTDTLDIQK